MSNSKGVPKWLSVVLLVLCALSVVHSIYTLITGISAGIPFALMCISSAILALASIAYCLGGYKKSRALLFKLVCLFLTVTALLNLITPIEEGSVLLIIINVLLAVIGLIFLFVPNLGKSLSYFLAALNLILTALMLILLSATGEILNPVESFVFAIAKMAVFGIMVYAKYVDKDARRTK